MKKLILFLIFFYVASCQSKKTDEIQLDESPNELEIFGENIISTPLFERDIAISPDGQEIIFTRGNYKQTKRCLVSIHQNENNWGSAKIVSFSGEYQDIEPFFSSDGSQLFFASNRPIAPNSKRKDYNIWVAQKGGSGWEEPIPLGDNINTKGDEYYPSVSKSGNLYFTATREQGIGLEDIFMSKFENGNYTDPTVLDTMINTSTYEFNAYINPDENLLIFSSFGRKDGLGGGDLYFSKKDNNGKWLPAKNMGTPINSEKLDFCPFIDYTNGNFYFTSERANDFDKKIESVQELKSLSNDMLNGMGNIYRIKMTGQFD